MRIYKVRADGQMFSLKPEFEKTAAGEDVTIDFLTECTVTIEHVGGGEIRVTRYFPPGGHNDDLELLGGKSDEEILTEFINRKIRESFPDLEVKNVLTTIEAAPGFSPSFEALVEEAEREMRESGEAPAEEAGVPASVEEELREYTANIPPVEAPAAPADEQAGPTMDPGVATPEPRRAPRTQTH